MHLVPVERSGKWGVASALYAGSKYPAYAKGGGYVLSALAAVRIVEAVRTGLSPLLSNVEDAMVGLAAAALNISATHGQGNARENAQKKSIFIGVFRVFRA